MDEGTLEEYQDECGNHRRPIQQGPAEHSETGRTGETSSGAGWERWGKANQDECSREQRKVAVTGDSVGPLADGYRLRRIRPGHRRRPMLLSSVRRMRVRKRPACKQPKLLRQPVAGPIPADSRRILSGQIPKGSGRWVSFHRAGRGVRPFTNAHLAVIPAEHRASEGSANTAGVGAGSGQIVAGQAARQYRFESNQRKVSPGREIWRIQTDTSDEIGQP